MAQSGFSASDEAQARAGKVVTRILPQSDDTASFVTGVVRIGVPAEILVDRVRSLEVFRSNPRVEQLGRFSIPPRLEDVQLLRIESEDVSALSHCRVGDCDLQIDRAVIDRARAIDWRAPTAPAQARSLIQQTLVGAATAYLERGSRAMPTYDDNDPPEKVAKNLETILPISPEILGSGPALYRDLMKFSGALPSNADSFLYWRKEDLHKAILSIVHVTIQAADPNGSRPYWIAIVHVYDSRYFLGYLEFLTLIPRAPGQGFYFVRSIRARINPPRFFRGMLLGRIKRAMRAALGEDLALTRARLDGTPP
jgi:hypothetical protein